MCSGLSLPPPAFRYKVFHYPFVLWRCDCVILWESIENDGSTCSDSCLIHIQMYTHTSFDLTDGKSRKFSFDWNFIAAQGAILLSARKSAFSFFFLLSVQWNAELSSTDWFSRFQRCYRDASSRSHGKFSVLCLISSAELDCKLHLTSGNCCCRSEHNVELSRTASHGNIAVHAWATPEIIIDRWIYLYHKKKTNEFSWDIVSLTR